MGTSEAPTLCRRACSRKKPIHEREQVQDTLSQMPHWAHAHTHTLTHCSPFFFNLQPLCLQPPPPQASDLGLPVFLRVSVKCIHMLLRGLRLERDCFPSDKNHLAPKRGSRQSQQAQDGTAEDGAFGTSLHWQSVEDVWVPSRARAPLSFVAVSKKIKNSEGDKVNIWREKAEKYPCVLKENTFADRGVVSTAGSGENSLNVPKKSAAWKNVQEAGHSSCGPVALRKKKRFKMFD